MLFVLNYNFLNNIFLKCIISLQIIEEAKKLDDEAYQKRKRWERALQPFAITMGVDPDKYVDAWEQGLVGDIGL